MSLLQSFTDSAITVIPYFLILLIVLARTKKLLGNVNASRFTSSLVLLTTPHLFVWLPNYIYQWSLFELDNSFAVSMGFSLLIEFILIAAFGIGLLKLLHCLKAVNDPA